MAGKPKPRHWKPDEIKPLPKRLYKRVYGEEYNDSWKLRFGGLSEDEEKALVPLLKQVKFNEIYFVPEVNKPDGRKTFDIWADHKKIEIKTPKSIKQIDKAFKGSYKQNADILLLGTHRLSNTDAEIKQKVVKEAGRFGGKGFISFGEKLKGFTSSKKARSPQTSVHDPEPFYVSILSKKDDFVKILHNNLVDHGKKPKLRTQTRTYWQKRSIERTLESERQSLPYLRQSRRVYAKSARAVSKQVQDIYAKYYKDNGFDVQALRELAPQGDVMRLKARMRKIGLETKLPDNYAARVNRLELLNLQMRAEAYEAGQKIKQLTCKSLAKTYENGYYRTIYDTAKGVGHTPAFSRLNKETVGKVLDTKNYGKNFSERIWGRSQKLGDELQSIIGTAIATGQSPAKTARLIRERFNVSANSAERLIRTETNYFENQAEIDTYKEMGVEEYQFLATIDTRTSEICQGHDHKTYKVSEAKVGVNMPPLHPNCRSTITPYFGKEWEPEIRIARNPQTGRNEYVTNMSYEEWFGKITDGTIKTIKPAKQINQVVPDGFFGFNAVLIEAYEKIPIEEANDDLFVKSKYTINNRDILLSGAELKFLSKLDELDIRYEVIPEQPGGNGTNDFKIFNQEWELKTRIKTDATTIMWALIKATDKNKENIILDVSYMDKPLSWVFNKVDEHLEKNKNAHKIKKIVIVRGKKFIQYK